MQSFTQSLSVYFERRMARILLLGIISGFPWVPDRQFAEPVVEGRRPEPHHDWLGRPDFWRLRLQLSLGAAHRPDQDSLADGPARAPPRVDRHPAGGNPGVPRSLEHRRADRQPRGRRRHRPRHRHRVRHPGHHHRRPAHRADRHDGRRSHGGGCGHRRGRLVDRIQARRRGRPGDGDGLPECGRRGLLAGHLSRARGRRRTVQHRTDVRARTSRGDAIGGAGGRREPGCLAHRRLRPTRPRCRVARRHGGRSVAELLPPQRSRDRDRSPRLYLPVSRSARRSWGACR